MEGGKENQNMNSLGPYLLIKKIATGGMADIYLAEGEGNKFVVKKLRKEFVHDQSFIHLLRSEVETLQKLCHPNILQAYKFISEGENHYAVLEYIEGKSLREILDEADEKKSPLPLPMILSITSQMAQALDALHHHHILHSDLNPRNVLIRKDGVVKLIDFSIAQTAENKLGATAGVGQGVIAYMSPEQANSEAIDSRSDIFSLGVLLHEMLTGEIPFAGKNRFEVYANLMHQEITLKTLPPSLDFKLKEILTHALAKKPEDRFQNMKEFEKALILYSQQK